MSCCKSFSDCLPVLSVIALVVWSYYAYVFELCFYTISTNWPKRITYLVIYHIILAFLIWTYHNVIYTDIAIVPEEFKVPIQLYEKLKNTPDALERNKILINFCLSKNIRLATRTDDGCIRFCFKCKHVKPDRAHHCSTCDTCVLRMDHHCPWINNCVALNNYKAFMLFLVYSFIYCVFFLATTFEYFILFWMEESKNWGDLHIVVGFILSLGMGLLLISFFCYHMSMISKNQTTLEVLREPTFNSENITFDIGTCQNFEQVFGDIPILWFFPLGKPIGDGINYPMRLLL